MHFSIIHRIILTNKRICGAITPPTRAQNTHDPIPNVLKRRIKMKKVFNDEQSGIGYLQR